MSTARKATAAKTSAALTDIPDLAAAAPPAPSWPDTVRALLIETWSEQGWRRPAEREAVLPTLLARHAAALDFAVTALAALDHSTPIPATAIWRAFSKLDKTHCRLLAERLAAAPEARP
jgi:hypothetical protein